MRTLEKTRKASADRGGIATVGALASALATMLFPSCSSMERSARSCVEEAAAAATAEVKELGEKLGTAPIVEADLADLPAPVRRYFTYSGVLGMRRVGSFSLILKGRIRQGRGESWMEITMRQFNRLDLPSRVVYIRAKKPPMDGVDSFVHGKGRMRIKVANLISVADSTGPEMDRSALVTFLNDLVLCPVAYFSLPVRWEPIDDERARLRLAYGGMEVSAILSFDEEGRIVNWASEDRYAEVKGQLLQDRWSTPFGAYGEFNGLRVPASGSAIHDYDGSPYTYVELLRVVAMELDPKGLPKQERD